MTFQWRAWCQQTWQQRCRPPAGSTSRGRRSYENLRDILMTPGCHVMAIQERDLQVRIAHIPATRYTTCTQTSSEGCSRPSLQMERVDAQRCLLLDADVRTFTKRRVCQSTCTQVSRFRGLHIEYRHRSHGPAHNDGIVCILITPGRESC
jgi:hypothetical protein